MAPATQKTPAKDSQNAGKMKQKSLMSFFAKTPAAAGSASSDAEPKTTKAVPAPERPKKAGDASRALPARGSDDTSSDPVVPEARTPMSKSASRSSVVVDATFTRSSDGAESYAQTPPTSDPIDVDMLSPDEEEKPKKAKATTAPTRKKRKLVFEDSDDEIQDLDADAYKQGLSAYKPSPEPEEKKGRAKKQRIAVELSDDEDEDELDVSSFSQRLTKFKPPAKAKPKRKASKADDDDDFIVPDDVSEDEDQDDDDDDTRPQSRASTSSSRASSRLSNYAHTSASEGEDGLPEPSSHRERPRVGKKPGVKRGSSNIFLTAAEQRQQAQKEEKKSGEDPFDFLLDVRDKDGARPNEQGYDPRTLYIPPKAWKTFTPFEKQFWEIKQNHFDTVLFFQKGKFLELYEEDARIGHQEFDLKLTQRVKMSMVGVPEQNFNFWAAKFLAKGYKVGRVDQAETALGAEMRVAADKGKTKAKASTADKIVRRELNKVYTNGTLVDEALLTDEQAGHCVAIREDGEEDPKTGKQTFGLCVLDSSTSEFNLSAFEDDVCRTKLETMVRQLRPKEIIFTKGNLSVPTTRLLKSILPSNCLWTSLRDSEGLSFNDTLKALKELYPPSADDDDDLAPRPHGLSAAVPEAILSMIQSRGAVEALGSMIWYLRTLNIDKDILTMKNFNVYDPMKKGQGLVLDGQTLAHIEVLVNSEGTEDGSLLKLLSRCVTPSGKRLFRIWLCMPLREIDDINARLDAVQDLMNHPSFEAEFSEVAKGLGDLERIVSRIHAKNCKVKDFLKVLDSFKTLSKGLSTLANTAEGFDSKTIAGLLRGAPDLSPHVKNVRALFDVEGVDELMPREGKDEEYDAVMEEIRELEDTLDKELKKLEKKTGLKLSYWHSAQGNKEIYLVQTKPKEKVPASWTKGSGTKAVTRWNVPDLATTIRSLKEARENRKIAIKSFKDRVYAEFDRDRSVWLRAIRVLSELDCLFSLAKSSVALGEPACRPEFVAGDEAFIDFDELRHPALSVSAGFRGDFIPNDVKLGKGVGRIALLTGPNMGGKSTAMRMTAAGVIMAQLGMFVPARRARLCPVDAILTRMGAYDNMFSNASTFKVELDECCKILREATPRSLVILDELGRGTSTYDGMAIAGAVLHELATHTLSLSFFATHYGSLTDDFAYHPNIRTMHMATHVDDEKRELVFLYKLVEGVASSSFGTHVANLAGVPPEVVQRAEVVSDDFAKQFKEKMQAGKQGSTSRLPLSVQADFAYLFSLVTGKAELPADKVRRREVLKVLKAAAKGYLDHSTAAAAAA
ncbi:MutS family DNA mismatch repair protein [Phanerochaete sordida]|uniref:DNA mismatch repair protein n=1 Tax=Phanerochaete sordida TaxID=48140 RepID=A0A9P3LHP5_9APHY|nr:MutS family DNA mismatch repair protein [Phanerochaete sordida]